MFNLFKNKQREEFDKDFYQFLKEYDQLIEKTTNIPNRKDGEDFVKATNRHILTFNDAFWRLENLDLDIASKLKAQTTDQEAEKLSLRHKINRTKTAIRDTIDQFESVKSAYLQGLQDGHNLERD